MYILNHFDNDRNLALDEIELKYAQQSILNTLPDLKQGDVTSQKINKQNQMSYYPYYTKA